MSTRRISRPGPVAAVALVASGLLGGVAYAVSEVHDPARLLGLSGQVSGAPVTYAGARPRGVASVDAAQAASRVLQGLGPRGPVRAVRVTPGSAGIAVEVTLGRNDDDVPQVWAADLAVGAVAELTRGDRGVISGAVAKATAVGPDGRGSPRTTSLGIGAVRLGQTFGSPADAVLGDRVRAVAAEFGLGVRAIEILHPLESALRVSLEVPAGAGTGWTIEKLRAALVGTTPDVEGVLIELVSPNGAPLLRSGVSYRTGEGGLWFAPGQDERFGAVHGGLPGSG